MRAQILSIACLVMSLSACTETGLSPPPEFHARPLVACQDSVSAPTTRCVRKLSSAIVRAATSSEVSTRAAQAPTATELMNWAEVHYPQYFPSRQADLSSGPYVYRYYPETRNYLGVADGSVYVLGPIAGGELAYVAPLSTFGCFVRPVDCFDPSLRIVVSPSGSDSADGTLERPFRTIARALSEARPGDTIQLRTGIYREAVSISKSGIASNPIVIRSFEGERGIVSGADLVRGWARHQGNIYVASFSQPIAQLFASGRRLNRAQYPVSGYLIMNADAASRRELRVDTGDVADRDLIGAGVHVRTLPWQIEDRVVSSTTATTVELASPTDALARRGYGYYFDNKLWMLTQPGQWFQDKVSGRVYAWLPDSNDPNTELMEAAVRGGISAKSADHIVLTDVAIERTASDSVVIDRTRNFVVTKTTITDSGESGILVRGGSVVRIDDSDIRNMVRDGVVIESDDGVVVQNCRLTNIGTVGAPVNSYAAIRSVLQQNVQVLDNTISNTGYIGVRIYKDSLVRGNVISDACQVLTDCGGIYMWDGRSPTHESTTANTEVYNNIISGATGNTQGAVPAQSGPSVGIYLDDDSNGLDVHDNIAFANQVGVQVHGGRNHRIRRNTVYGNRDAQLKLVEDYAPSTLRGNIISNNVFFPSTEAPSILVENAFGSIDFGTMSANTFGTLYSPIVVKEYLAEEGARRFTLSTWQAATGSEQLSTVAPDISMKQFIIGETASPEMITNGAFARDSSGWGLYSGDETGGLSRAAECPGLKTAPCLRFFASEANLSLLISNTFSLIKGSSYLVSFDIFGLKGLSDRSPPTKAIVRRNGPTYDDLGLDKEIYLLNTWRTHQYVFTATESGTNFARLDIQIPKGAEALIDNVSVRAVSLSGNDPTGNQQLLVNATNESRLIPCPSSGLPSKCAEYIGLDGTVVTFPVNLPPKSAKVIVWGNSPYRVRLE